MRIHATQRLALPFGLWIGIFVVLSFSIHVNAEEARSLGKAAYLFDEAIQSYLKGNSRLAVEKLETAYAMEPDNSRTRIFLLKVLVERGSRLFLLKKYEQAYGYLSRAYNLDPQNLEIRDMFKLCARQLKPQVAKDNLMLIPKGVEDALLQQTAAENSEVAAIGLPKTSPATPSPSDELFNQIHQQTSQATNASYGVATQKTSLEIADMMQLMTKFQDFQEKQMAQFMAPLERIQNLYYQSEKDRQNLMLKLDDRFKSVLGSVSFQQRMVIYGFVFGLLLLGLITYAFLMIVSRLRSRREESIMKYQQEMLKMVRDMAALPAGTPYGIFPAGANYALRQAYTPQSAPRLTAAPTSVKEGAEVLVNPGDDPLQNLLLQAAQGNYKERAIAIIQIMQVDPQKALELVKQALGDPDPFFRENMAGAMGQCCHPLAIELLLERMQDTEDRVVKATQRSLNQLLQLPEEMLNANMRNEIVKILNPGAADKKRGKRKNNA